MALDPLLDALLLGIVEGLTEFLPVSSTGHLIVVSDLLGLNDEKGKVFDIVIQLGAILAVCWEYRARVRARVLGAGGRPRSAAVRREPLRRLPSAAIVGLALQSKIKAYLFNPVSVAIALIVGALAIFAIERWYERHGAPRVARVDDMELEGRVEGGAGAVPVARSGTSRSGATIMGGMVFGLSREAATEFSFFLAVPIMFAATGYQMVKYRELLSAADLAPSRVGFVVSFVFALVAVRALIRYVARHDFRAFALVPDRLGRGGCSLLPLDRPSPASQGRGDSGEAGASV
jgi:undecaprenyl-diphosphatase